MAKVIMTSSEYVERLKKIAARNTYYSNKYPNNLCYVHKDGRTSADCWNLIKAILNGYDVNNTTVGYYQKNLSNTGDVDGATLIGRCSDVSTDFSKLKNGEPRLLYMSGHAGSYIGDTIINGRLYNVIECTGSWERKVLYSYVDEYGWRRHYKGSTKNGRWLKHGKMTPWVSYDGTVPAVQPAQPVQQEKEEYKMPTIKKGSSGKAVKIWQIIIGATPDGVFGPITEANTRKWQSQHLDANGNKLVADGIVGPKTWKAGLDSLS